MKWYAIRTLANKENKAKENLERVVEENNMSKYVGNIILPKEKIYKLKNKKKVVSEKLLFSNYIFIQTSAVGELKRLLSQTKDVIGFSGNRDGQPVPMRESEVEKILKVVEENENVETEEKVPFLQGELVTVTDGPFKDFEGTVSNIDEDKKLLEVVVKIFGRENPVKLSYLQVEKAIL